MTISNIFGWLTTAGDNDDLNGIPLDPNLMFPSHVNDAFQEAMKQVAGWRSLLGYPTAAGTANALTLTPSPAITAYASGMVFTFRAAADNTNATVKLNVNGVADKNIRKIVAGADVALGVGDIMDDQRYKVVYDAAADTAAGASILVNPSRFSDYVAYTPTFTGFGTPSGVSIWSRRLGDCLHIRGKFTSGTSTAVEARMTLGFNGTNGNVTSDTTKVASIQVAGLGAVSTPAAAQFFLLVESGLGYLTFGLQNAGNGGLTKQLGNSLLSSGTAFSFTAEIPISGW